MTTGHDDTQRAMPPGQTGQHGTDYDRPAHKRLDRHEERLDRLEDELHGRLGNDGIKIQLSRLADKLDRVDAFMGRVESHMVRADQAIANFIDFMRQVENVPRWFWTIAACLSVLLVALVAASAADAILDLIER